MRRQQELTIFAPMNGEVIPLCEVADAVFSQKILGDGAAVRPREGRVYAPCDGVVTMIADTGHAVSVQTAQGVEVLVHVGLDTVALEGRPFTVHTALGARVAAGDTLLLADLEAIAAAGYDVTTPVIVCNKEPYTMLETASGAVTQKDWLLRLK